MDQEEQKVPEITEELQNNTPVVSIQPESKHHKHAKVILVAVFSTLILIVGMLSIFLKNENSEEPIQNNSAVEQTPSNETQESAVEKKQVAQPALSADWYVLTTSDYSMKIPDGWQMVLQDNNVVLMECGQAADCYELQSGTRATVEEVVGGRDGLQGFLYTLVGAGSTIDEYTTGYTYINDITGSYKLYESEVVASTEEDLVGSTLPVGTKQYVVIKQLDDGRLSYFGFSVVAEQTTPLSLVEEMITTLTIGG